MEIEIVTPSAVSAVAGQSGAEVKKFQRKAAVVDNQATRQLGSRSELLYAFFMALAFAGLFVLGNRYWSERYYTPEEGLGYYLGLTGGIIMVLASAYSLMKRSRLFRPLMRHWLRMHIILGVLGPFLVLVHSTFRIGSMNGGVALVSMCVVFASGLIGRYLYTHIYLGLDGRRARSQELAETINQYNQYLRNEQIERLQASVLREPRNILFGITRLVTVFVRCRWARIGLRRAGRRTLLSKVNVMRVGQEQAKEQYRYYRQRLDEYLNALRTVALFGVYERLFALWRSAHIPLIYLLWLSGVVHVIAVHMY